MMFEKFLLAVTITFSMSLFLNTPRTAVPALAEVDRVVAENEAGLIQSLSPLKQQTMSKLY